MQALDLAIVAAFFAYAIAVGLRSRRQASRNAEEYFLAGRSLPGWKAGLSMAATQFAADTPLVVTGLIATAGLFALWRMWIYALAFLLLGFVLARCWRRSGVTTDAELAELRYGSWAAPWLRATKAVYFGTVFNCTVLAMVLLAATRIAEPFLAWDQWLPQDWHAALADGLRRLDLPLTAVADEARRWTLSANNVVSLAAILGATAFYSTTGGLRAVVETDVVQFAIAMLATLLFAWYVVDAVGGFAALHAGLRAAFAPDAAVVVAGLSPPAPGLVALTPDVARDAGMAVLALYAIQWLAQMNADGTGYLAQRCMACRSDRDAQVAALVFTWTQVLLRSLLWLPIGLGLLLLFPPGSADVAPAQYAAQREATWALGMAELLPTGARGLMLAGMLAALASTVDTHLNWGASYWTQDLYRRFVAPRRGRPDGPRTVVRVARVSAVVILLLALVVMFHLDSIQQAWRISLLLGAGMGVMLVLRWMWWRISAAGELAAIVVSLPLAPLLLWLVQPGPGLDANAADALRLIGISLGATAVGIGVSYAAPEDPRRLQAFYLRAEPPGWWGPVARACGQDPAAGPRRLARGLLAAGLAAASLFALLVGLGSWIADSPAPSAWPAGRAAWVLGCTALGLALVPAWWRLGFGAPRAAAAVAHGATVDQTRGGSDSRPK